MKTFGAKAKQIMRKHVASLVDKSMTIFSLPHTNFEIEAKAAVAVCCEVNNEIYQQQQLLAPPNCILNHCFASEKIAEGPYDLVYLDLCGSLSYELFLCLERINLTEKGILIVTLLKAREPKKFTVLLKPNRLEGYCTIFETYNLYIYKTIEYKDSSPMIVIFARQDPLKPFESIKQLQI